MRTITTLFLSAAVTAFAGVASAEPDTIRIPVTQADLETREAIADLYQRIETAADRVCRDADATFYTTISTCKTQAVEDAIASAEIASLSAYAEDFGRREAVVEIASR